MLLVEDDEIIARVTARVLLTRGEVTRVDSGEAALERLAQIDWSLVVLDVELPGIGGVELIGHVQRVAPQATILVLSGHASFERAVEALRAGADAYMTKPFEPAALIAKADELIERSRLRRIAATPAPQRRASVSSGPSAR